jgi:hypothetical protein
MPGRGFLDVARELSAGTTEFHWRAAVVHAYYALFLECRDLLFRWGRVMPRRDNVHAWVRLRFTYAADADLKHIGDTLDYLVKRRNLASYELSPLPMFASSSAAHDAVQQAADALALLDQVDGDPVRRKTANASLPP